MDCRSSDCSVPVSSPSSRMASLMAPSRAMAFFRPTSTSCAISSLMAPSCESVFLDAGAPMMRLSQFTHPLPGCHVARQRDRPLRVRQPPGPVGETGMPWRAKSGQPCRIFRRACGKAYEIFTLHPSRHRRGIPAGRSNVPKRKRSAEANVTRPGRMTRPQLLMGYRSERMATERSHPMTSPSVQRSACGRANGSRGSMKRNDQGLACIAG